MVYAPGTLETDQKKQNMALQQQASAISALRTSEVISSRIAGTTTNDNAATGIVGEFSSATLAYASRVTFSTGVSENIASLSLAAGDWDVTGFVNFEGTSTPSTSFTRVDLSTTSATSSSTEGYYAYGGPINSSNADITGNIPLARFSLASTTTVYLVGTTGILGGTIKGWGFIRARRVR